MVRIIRIFFYGCLIYPVINVIWVLKYGKFFFEKVILFSEVTLNQILMLGLLSIGIFSLILIFIIEDYTKTKTRVETRKKLESFFEAGFAEALEKGILIGEYNHLVEQLKKKSQELQRGLFLHKFSYGKNDPLFLSRNFERNVFFISGPDGVVEQIDLYGENFGCDIPDKIFTTDKGYEIGPIQLIKTYGEGELKSFGFATVKDQVNLIESTLKEIESVLEGKVSTGGLIRTANNFGLRIEKEFIGQPPEIKIVSPTSSIGPDPDRSRAMTDSIAEAVVQATVNPVPPTEKVLSQYDLAKSKVSASGGESTSDESHPDSIDTEKT